MGGSGRDVNGHELGQRLLAGSGKNGFYVILGPSGATTFEANVSTRFVPHFDGACIGGVNMK